jgi:hypothetical protein
MPRKKRNPPNYAKVYLFLEMYYLESRKKMNKLFLAAGLVIVLLVFEWTVTLTSISNQPVFADPSPNYDVRVLVHINDAINTTMIRSMLEQLPVVTGIQFAVWVADNTTNGIVDAKNRINNWLSEFTDYNIVIQCDYAFEAKYGYWEKPFWKFNNTETLSQEWYTNWYGNLSEVLNQYPNVQLMVGSNEPYNHFQTKEMTQTIMKREYTTWKNISAIPFTVKFSMPYLMWADYWKFPENASIEADCVPFWANYSDYIGMDLWAENAPPQYGIKDWTAAYYRVTETIAMAENYSEQLKKPIFIGEYPAWNPRTFAYICDHIAKAPNIGQVYQLWYWSGQEDPHQDAYTYGLFNVDLNTLQVTRGEPEWRVLTGVLNPP